MKYIWLTISRYGMFSLACAKLIVLSYVFQFGGNCLTTAVSSLLDSGVASTS